MSRDAVLRLLASGRMPHPGGATEEEVFQALHHHAQEAWKAHGSPADRPVDEGVGHEMARRIMERRK